jgi:hypothetical protein
MRDYAEARTCAVSAIELGLLHIKQDPSWRTTWPSGTWMQDQPLGSGKFTLQGVDSQDGDFADSPFDSVVLIGIGAKGIARHKVQVVVSPVIKPVEALTSCLQGSGSLQVTSGNKITAVGAPVCTNGQLSYSGTIDGTAEAQSLGTHTGTVTGGTPLVPGAVKHMPDSGLIAKYAAKGTVVAYSATREKFVLAPGYSTFGTTDPNGLYVINTGGSNLTIQKCRIYGTLVVQAGTGTVTLNDPLFLQNYRSDFPVLLVSGNLVLKYKTGTGDCTESTCTINLNPAGAPYLGVTDTDKTDSYPNEIDGLIHVEGTLSLQQTAKIVGAVICNGSITCAGTNTISYPTSIPSLYACPPQGYTYVSGMKPSPGSWKQLID